MKKKTVSGILAVLMAFFAVTGTAAASEPIFQSEEIQEEFHEEDLPEQDAGSDFSEGGDVDLDEISEPEFEEEPEPESFDVSVQTEKGMIVFESDLLSMEEQRRETLTEEDFLMMQAQEHVYLPGDVVRFYVRPFEGYECSEVTAEGEESALSLSLNEDGTYEFFMPQSSVVLSAEFIRIAQEEAEEEIFFSDGQGNVETVSSAVRAVNVKAVSSDYKMDPKYAFTYAFREGVTKLVSVQGASSALPAQLDRQFGWSASSSYGPNYKNTLYACSIQNTSMKGRISAKYTNVGEYQGKIADLKITAVEWGPVSNKHIGADNTAIVPCILFYNNRIAFSTISVGTVRFRFEFFDNKTGKQIYPKGHVTMMDLDGGQGFLVYDGWGVDGMYVRSGYDHLNATAGYSDTGVGYTEVRAPEGVSTSTEDVKGWCHVDFDSSFTVNWLSGAAGLKGTAPYMAFFMSGAQTVGTYEPNSDPEKKVGNTGTAYEKMTKHESQTDLAAEPPYDILSNGEFDYMIAQNVLPGNYRKFEVTDTLDSCLEYKGAEVMTALGNDITHHFDITETKNTVRFAAKSSFLNTDECCNDVTYYFRIHVSLRSAKAVVEHGHYGKGNYYYIQNQAERTLESSQRTDTKKTNVSWVRGCIESDCRVRKTDAEDHEKILPGAVFEIYQWNKAEKKYKPTGQQLVYIEDTKLYTTVKKLCYDPSNEGKFRVIETQAPEEYEGSWQADIDILKENFQDKILEAENTLARLPCGEITVTKKIREKDIIWAHGNPVFRFEINGTDQRGMSHTYRNYVEFQKGNYGRQGEYAVLSYTFSGVPLGEYTISEKETLRYQFQGITANTSNAGIAGRNGVVILDRKNKTAAVTFTNIKTRFDGCSHTDVIRNSIPLKKTE